MFDTVDIRANKNVIHERTGRQMLHEAQTKYNTTRYALYSRLSGMTKNEYHPHYSTTADRYFRNRYPPLFHETIRNHSSFTHMADRPVDLAAGTLSSPIVRDDLWLQHIKVSYPDSFFTDLGITRENITIHNLQSTVISSLGDLLVDLETSNQTSFLSQFRGEWEAIRNYNLLTGNSNFSSTLVNSTNELSELE